MNIFILRNTSKRNEMKNHLERYAGTGTHRRSNRNQRNLSDAQTKQQLKTSLAIPMYLHFLHVGRSRGIDLSVDETLTDDAWPLCQREAPVDLSRVYLIHFGKQINQIYFLYLYLDENRDPTCTRYQTLNLRAQITVAARGQLRKSLGNDSCRWACFVSSNATVVAYLDIVADIVGFPGGIASHWPC